MPVQLVDNVLRLRDLFAQPLVARLELAAVEPDQGRQLLVSRDELLAGLRLRVPGVLHVADEQIALVDADLLERRILYR